MLDLKTVFSDFCGQSLICELILTLVSLWLLVNSFKETSKEKRPIDFFHYFGKHIKFDINYIKIINIRYFGRFYIILLVLSIICQTIFKIKKLLYNLYLCYVFFFLCVQYHNSNKNLTMVLVFQLG